MENLDLSKQAKEIKPIKFDELMTDAGNWIIYSNSSLFKYVFDLNYKSQYFNYYIAETVLCNIYLLRNKK